VASRNSTFLAELGPGGLSSLTLALASGLVGLGVPVFWRLREVLRVARSNEAESADLVLVLGRELVADRPTRVFEARLEYAAELWRAGLAPRILVSGGWTGTARRSEASAGRSFLERRGIPPEAIWIEERSRHTLENLFNVRDTMRERGWQRLLLVSDPLHLARAATLARGLGLDFRCAPAVQAPPSRGGVGWWLRAGRESFLLHWYHVGLAYSRLIRSERLQSRVT